MLGLSLESEVQMISDLVFPNMGIVEVIRIPAGEGIPLDVRAGWLGLHLPYLTSAALDKGEAWHASGKPAEAQDVVIVPKVTAILILKQHKPRSADWFIRHDTRGDPRRCNFAFRIADVRLVRKAPPPPLEIWDMMDPISGDPNK